MIGRTNISIHSMLTLAGKTARRSRERAGVLGRVMTR